MLPRKTLTAGIALAAVALITVPAVAYAARQDDSLFEAARASASVAADPPPGLVDALARDLGVTGEQAEQRLLNEAAAAEAEPALRAMLGPAYAGTWVTGPTATPVAATTDPSKAAGITAAGVQARVVTRSLDQLDGAKAALDRAAAEAPRTAPVWYVDVVENTVVVLTSTPAKAAAWVRASGADASAVRVVRSAEQPRPYYDVRGGDAYYIGSGSRCSVGFSVTRAGSQGGFVTAGHCGSTGATTTGSNRVAQGTFHGSSFPGNDYAWVEVNTQWTPVGVVNGYSAGILPVRGSTVAQPGSSICRSGSTTQWRCGSVQQLNTSVTYPQGTVSGVTRTSVCAEPGDSGGSFISGDQAQGVTSGGSGNCSSGGTTYFQPVNEILSTYGLTLATQGGGPSPTVTPTNPGGTWAPNTAYATGATVTYGGATYRCLQGHTSQTGWEPPNVPALWQRV
ncbi:carbohydrate-binding protein [Nonomuraea gerenzanensis]|uniref:Catechol 1,2-dioxygenase 1 n=1 Tax=Nonomuraea gerenzanensis TaxID=93944 RepID=A0A1M4DWA2_9ACTN|nr:carbohydrate-binding protein [Nonomuraea gerenzanensis]UBU13191.1 alpha-lytic protease prodomain-containing protein [Nonomuraea gerenzanensis]SBO90840.1 Catechol 1,2-dioxygenase 1 [Nonomuraea gerenzanensis]